MPDLHDLLDWILDTINLNSEYSEWYQKQTINSWISHLRSEISELEEIIEIETNSYDPLDSSKIKAEVGDVLINAFNLTMLCCKEFDFSLASVMRSILDKLKRRKPHIFQHKHMSLDEEVAYWQSVKFTQTR